MEKMKIIKKGKPYRIHKCSKCKTVYVYKYRNTWDSDLVYCPECKNYLDFHFLDKKISQEKYEKLCELEGNDE